MNIKRLFIISGSLLLGLTIILIWLLFGPPILTRAASYTVCPAGPPTCDYNSVQSAVDAAGDGDVIKVAAGTYTGINNKGGLAQVVYLDKSVTIRGGYTTTNWTTSDPVANPTTLDAQGDGRVLYITGNISPTIEGLRITGGDATGWGGKGGGVYIDYATATIRNNQVFSNTATNMGGGLFLAFSPTTLSDNTIFANVAPNGAAGVFLDNSAATLSHNTIISNTGAGLVLAESDNSTLIGNTVSYNDGGGISLDVDNVTVSGNIISNNSGDYSGGGITGRGHNVTLIGNIISSNYAHDSGGGVMWDGDIELIGNTIISNTAGEAGGGLMLGGGNPILTNNIIVDNHAENAGSAIFITGWVPFSHLLHNTITHKSSCMQLFGKSL